MKGNNIIQELIKNTIKKWDNIKNMENINQFNNPIKIIIKIIYKISSKISIILINLIILLMKILIIAIIIII